MEPKDWIGLVGLIVTFVMSLVALIRTSRHNTAIRQYASAAPDIALMGQINQAKQTMTNISVQITEIAKGKMATKRTANENRQIAEMGLAYSQAVESLLNSYDLACRLYRDEAIDRDRFRRQYEWDIRELFEQGTEEDKARLHGSTAIRFQALRAVYNEWFIKEK